MNRDSPQLRSYFDEGEQRDGDELVPFDFDEDNDYGDNNKDFIPNEDEYDAINDETFGCAEPITNDEGLDILAERAKLLDLVDVGHDDKDFAWPDPADIPLPSAFKDHGSSEFAAWVGSADLRPSTSGFAGPSDLFMFDNESKDSEYKLTEDDLYRDLSRHWDSTTPTKESQSSKAGNLFKLFAQSQQSNQKPGVKPQILTEEMLLKLNAEEEEKQRQRNLMKELGLLRESPVISAQAGWESIEPEHDMYLSNRPVSNSQSQSSKVHMQRRGEDLWSEQQQQQYGNYSNNRSANFYQNTQPPSFGQQPPPNYQRKPNNYGQNDFQRNQNYYQQHFPPLHKPFGNTNQPPYPMPPFNGVSPNVMNLMNMHSNQPPPGLPSGRGPFPQHFNGSMYPPPPFPPPMSNMLAQQRASMSGSMRGSNTSLSSTRTRKPFLPSTKTLSDFAFDPYAGFMSKKEREWLIKIQLIQCMISGDPIQDDYYYSAWKERNVLAKAPLEWRVKIQPRYYNFDNTYPSERYVAPAFIGSLGRPTHSSTSFPRQIIELQSDSIDEDTESTTGKSIISQKKLRAILLRIENAALSLLECRDVLYKSSKSESLENENVLSVVNEKIQAIIECVASPNELPTVMLVQKGRYLIGQLITYSDDSQASEIMSTLVQTTPRFAHRIQADSNNQPLMRAIVTKSRNMDPYTFKLLREALPIDSLEPLLEISSFVQQLCLAFMIGLCGREVQVPTSGPIGAWLADNDVKRLHALIPVFNQDAVDFDLLQLNSGLSFFPPNSIGRQLAELLKTRIKQRPS